jgi:hypothetical protein
MVPFCAAAAQQKNGNEMVCGPFVLVPSARQILLGPASIGICHCMVKAEAFVPKACA